MYDTSNIQDSMVISATNRNSTYASCSTEGYKGSWPLYRHGFKGSEDSEDSEAEHETHNSGGRFAVGCDMIWLVVNCQM